MAIYAKAFYGLQLQFAHKVACLSQLPLEEVLLTHTNFYVGFGLGREFNVANSIWQTYLDGLQNTDDMQDWTYGFAMTRAEVSTAPPVVATFGCFSYALLHDGRLRLHFKNAQTDDHSSLSIQFFEQRRKELICLFRHVKQTMNEKTQVVGASWMYNLDAYRRLFPPSYLVNARVFDNRFQTLTLWGQFLDRYGFVKENMACSFLGNLERQTEALRLQESFPFQVLWVESPASDFFDFYNI